jgi:hypothetical protein
LAGAAFTSGLIEEKLCHAIFDAVVVRLADTAPSVEDEADEPALRDRFAQNAIH